MYAPLLALGSRADGKLRVSGDVERGIYRLVTLWAGPLLGQWSAVQASVCEMIQTMLLQDDVYSEDVFLGFASQSRYGVKSSDVTSNGSLFVERHLGGFMRPSC